MASSENTQGQAAPLGHPAEGLQSPPPGAPRVRAFRGEYSQTWQPASFDSVKVSVSFEVDCGEGISPEDAYNLANGYTGLAQCAVWRRALPVLERSGRIPSPSVLKRVAGSDVEALRWVKDNTGIPIEFRRQLGEELAAALAGQQAEILDRAVMLEGDADLLAFDDSRMPYNQDGRQRREDAA